MREELTIKIAKIIDQLRNGETTAHLAEEVQKSLDRIIKKPLKDLK